MSIAPTRGPLQRPGIERDLTELFQRVEDLERVPDCCDEGTTTYPDAVLANPTVIHYWPMDDVGPGAVDVVGSFDLIENPLGTTDGQPVSNQGSYSFTYQQSGPFAGLPSATSIGFDGDEGGPHPLGTCLYGNGFAVGSTQWSMIGWSYNDFSYPGRTVGSVFSLYGGGSPTTQLYVVAGDLTFLADTGVSYDAVADNAITTPGWHFWAVTVDTAALQISLYLDGVLAETASFAGSVVNGGYLRFGCQGTSVAAPSNFWKGKTCQVATFTSVLNATEIADFYEGGAGAAAGLVWTSDGAGGASWELGTIEVSY